MGKSISQSEINQAEIGQALYQYKLAMHYADDDCLTEAQYWLEKAASQNYIPALYALGSLLSNTKRENQAIAFFVKAANMGHSESLSAIKDLYREGDSEIKDQIVRTLHPRAYKAISSMRKSNKYAHIDQVDRFFDRMDYYIPGIGGAVLYGATGFYAGLELYPYYYIIPIILGIIGTIIGFVILKGKHWGRHR